MRRFGRSGAVPARCQKYVLPVMLFPAHLLSDTYTEIVMADLNAGTPMFWIIVLIDVVLLVMRDAGEVTV